MSELSTRDVLLYLSNKYEGEWQKIFTALKKKESVGKEEEIKKLISLTKANYVDITSEMYPECFKESYNPPFLFYYYGNLDLLRSRYRMTCIGTRKPTVYQTDTCDRLIREVEEHFNNEVVIISGMAFGLDQVCMEAAMRLEAPVVSIIGSGIDNPYPSENHGLYEYCKTSKGLLISEYPLEIEAQPKNFIFRNRLLAASSSIIFVGGGKNLSGTSATVRMALERGKEITALPCNVTGNDLSNTLIKDGATSILSSEDLIKELMESSF
jgi:DNA processing protein